MVSLFPVSSHDGTWFALRGVLLSHVQQQFSAPVWAQDLFLFHCLLANVSSLCGNQIPTLHTPYQEDWYSVTQWCNTTGSWHLWLIPDIWPILWCQRLAYAGGMKGKVRNISTNCFLAWIKFQGLCFCFWDKLSKRKCLSQGSQVLLVMTHHSSGI